MIPIHLAKIEKGKIVGFVDRQRFDIWLGSLKDGMVEIEIKEIGSRRSQRQNNFYWVYLEIIEKDTGHNRSELHELFKQQFLTYSEKEVMGKIVKIYKSTTRLNKKEFSEYIDKIADFTNIPPPYTELCDQYQPNLEKK